MSFVTPKLSCTAANENCIWRISTDENHQIALGLVNQRLTFRRQNHLWLRPWLFDSLQWEQWRSTNFRDGKAFGGRAFRTIYSSGPHLYINMEHISKREDLIFAVFPLNWIVCQTLMHLAAPMGMCMHTHLKCLTTDMHEHMIPWDAFIQNNTLESSTITPLQIGVYIHIIIPPFY